MHSRFDVQEVVRRQNEARRHAAAINRQVRSVVRPGILRALKVKLQGWIASTPWQKPDRRKREPRQAHWN